MAAPTFVNEYQVAWNTNTSPKTTSNFNVLDGDLIVAYASGEHENVALANPPTGTLSGTWTLRQFYEVTPSGYTTLYLWTLPITANQTGVNVTFTLNYQTGYWGGGIQIWRNHGGVGTSNKAQSSSGDPTLTLSSVAANSAIVMINGDWTPIDATSSLVANTAQAGTFTTKVNIYITNYAVEAGYYADAGTTGNKVIGITDPNGMVWSLAGVEIKGPTTPTVKTLAALGVG